MATPLDQPKKDTEAQIHTHFARLGDPEPEPLGPAKNIREAQTDATAQRVDGPNPLQASVGGLSQYLQGFILPRCRNLSIGSGLTASSQGSNEPLPSWTLTSGLNGAERSCWKPRGLGAWSWFRSQSTSSSLRDQTVLGDGPTTRGRHADDTRTTRGLAEVLVGVFLPAPLGGRQV